MKTPEKLTTANQGSALLDRHILHLVFSRPLELKAVNELAEKAGFGLFELPGDNATRRPDLIVNRTSYACFVQKTNGKVTDKDYDSIYESFGDQVETVNPVYFRKEGDYPTYFSPRVDTLILALAEAQGLRATTLRALENAGLTIDPVRSTYLSGKLVVQSKSARNNSVLNLAARLKRYADINEVYFEQSPLISPVTAAPNDPLYAPAWHLPKIEWNADLVGCNTTTVIAVIDQGVDLKHPDLNFASPGLKLNTMTPDGSPTGNHGTACAGIAAALVNNNRGVAGVAGKAKILPLAVVTWSDLEIANGLNYATSFGADVISMSFGVYDTWSFWNYDLIDPEIIFADNQGTFMCAATGNENRLNDMRYPSKHPLVLSVGGSNKDDRRKSVGDSSAENWWGACYGEQIYEGNKVGINVVAPCLQIPTTDRLGAVGYVSGDYFLTFNGTSSATPIVAGLAALIKTRYPHTGNSTVKRIIERSADKVGGYTYTWRPEYPNSSWSSDMGHGRVNVRKALKLAADLLAGKGCECCPAPARIPGLPIAFSVMGRNHTSKGGEKHLTEFIAQNLNEGAGFQNGIFTAPEDGIYEFGWSFVRDTLYNNGTEDDVFVFMKVNTTPVQGVAFAGQIFDPHSRATGSANVLVKLSQGDEVCLFVRSDGGKQRNILEFLFSGHKLASS